jgi:hypothetical protein
MIQYKETKKLYQGKYQHRIVLVAPGAAVFRGGDMVTAYSRIEKQEVITSNISDPQRYYPFVRKRSELEYLFKIHNCLKNLEDYTVRVEGVLLSIYTNNLSDIDSLKDISPTNVKSIYHPCKKLEEGEVVSTLPYDYKVTLKNVNTDHSSFVAWAKANENIRLLKSCESALTDYKKYLNSPSYFYVKGDKTLLMTKIHLGSVIRAVERLVKP